MTSIAWLDEDDCQVTVDLTRGTAQNLPEGVTLEEVRHGGDSGRIELCFRVPNFGGSYPQLFDWTYTDPEGGTHQSNSSGMNTDDTEDVYYEMFYLDDYPYDSVILTLIRTQWGALEEPVAIEIGGLTNDGAQCMITMGEKLSFPIITPKEEAFAKGGLNCGRTMIFAYDWRHWALLSPLP